jgi:hypothetical protein
MAQIDPVVLKRIYNDDDIYAIAKHLGVGFRSVERWIINPKYHHKLTTNACLAIIKERTGLAENEILIQDTVALQSSL